MVHGRDRAGFPVVLLAVHVHADVLERQSAFDEDDLAIGSAGDALGVDVEGLHREPAVGQGGLGRFVGRSAGGGEEAVFVEGGRGSHPPIVSGRAAAPGCVTPRRAGTRPNAVRWAPDPPAFV